MVFELLIIRLLAFFLALFIALGCITLLWKLFSGKKSTPNSTQKTEESDVIKEE